MFLVACIFICLAALAAANGGNDVSKGVATLAGSGVTRYRTAILWGALTTLGGALVSGLVAERMFKLFTSGIIAAKPTPAFTLAVTIGAVGWVAVATVTRLPVSTTHAIIGSLLGAGMFYAPASVMWASVAPRLAIPLLFSIVFSYGLSASLNRIFAQPNAESVDCICVGAELVRLKAFQMLALAIEHAHVRTEEFVRRAHQKIAIERADINRPVRGIVDSVDVGQCTAVVSKLHDLLDRVDRPHGV